MKFNVISFVFEKGTWSSESLCPEHQRNTKYPKPFQMISSSRFKKKQTNKQKQKQKTKIKNIYICYLALGRSVLGKIEDSK